MQLTLASIQKIAATMLAIFPLSAQLPVQILCGSATDKFFVGTSQPEATCTLVAPQTCTYTDTAMPAPYQTLRYGPSIHYRIPMQAGVYVGFLHWVEPNKTAAGQRLFTVTIQNGETSAPIDVFALAPGLDVHYAMPFLCVAQIGACDIQLTAVTGNAIISEIDLAGAPLTASNALGPIRLFQDQYMIGEPVIFAAFVNGRIQ